MMEFCSLEKLNCLTLTNTSAGIPWKVGDLGEYKLEAQDKHEIQSIPLSILCLKKDSTY